MTFKDLKKMISLETITLSGLFRKTRCMPYWIWDINQHKQEDIKTGGNVVSTYYRSSSQGTRRKTNL